MNEQTMTKLVEMKMNGMAEAYAEQSSNSDFKRMEFDDRLALLIDFEHSRRKNSKLNRLIQSASFINSTACVEDIEYHADRRLNKDQILKLASGTDWYKKRHLTVQKMS